MVTIASKYQLWHNQDSSEHPFQNLNQSSIFKNLRAQMNGYMLLLLFLPALILIFFFTKASFGQFLMGFVMCLIGQTTLILIYCFFKVHQALKDSSKITLEKNPFMSIQEEYPFHERKQSEKLFLNRYTEQEKLETKKNTVKVQSFEHQISQNEVLSQEPKNQMMKYLRERKKQYKRLSVFNQALVEFGKSFEQLKKVTLIPLQKHRYEFERIESQINSEIPQQQLGQFERHVLDDLEVKLKVKKSDTKQIALPTWQNTLEGFRRIGEQFEKLSEIGSSNHHMIEMASSQIVQDFNFISDEIKRSLKSLEDIQRTSELLKKENEQFLSNERQNKDREMDLVFLLKQQYYKYQDFELRIKQNEKNYHIQTKKLSYYREKLGSFFRKNKEIYDKIFKTRLFAMLDSYNITIEESLELIKQIFSVNHQMSASEPPVVNKLQIHRNIDHQIASELRYQQQYFDRVEFYSKRVEGFIGSMTDLSVFLKVLARSFQNLDFHLIGLCKQNTQDSQTYYRGLKVEFLKKFLESVQKISHQINHLNQLNTKFEERNHPYLDIILSKIRQKVSEATETLQSIKNPEGPVVYRYKTIKEILEQRYMEIENEIGEIRRFSRLFQSHSNRLKKIIIMEVINFVNLQKMFLEDSDFIRKNFENIVNEAHQRSEDHFNVFSTANLAISLNGTSPKLESDECVEENGRFNEEEMGRQVEGIGLTQEMHHDYVALLNRFLFAAYSEWKNSSFFKENISKELYIVLNKQENESLSEVSVEHLELLGYPPQIVWVKELPSENFQFLADIAINFKGKLISNLKTSYKLMGISFPTEVKVEFEEFYCVVRVCLVPSEIGQSWFAYIGEPIAKFTIIPKIYSIELSAETVTNLISDIMLKKFRENIFPKRERIMIPASKLDLDFERIQKRMRGVGSLLVAQKY